MGGSLQFIGVDSVVKAFESSGFETWAVCSGKSVNMAGEGVDELREFITMLNPNSVNIYTLKVFNIPADDINEKSVACRSFNFTLTERIGKMGKNGELVSNPLTGTLESMVAGIIQEKYKDKIAAKVAKIFEDDDEEDEEPTDIVSQAMGFLSDPVKLQGAMQIIGVVREMFFNKGQQQPYTPTPPPAIPLPARVAGFNTNDMDQQQTVETPEQKQMRLVTVLNSLERQDPNILQHLEQLNQIAINKPRFFKTLLGYLEEM